MRCPFVLLLAALPNLPPLVPTLFLPPPLPRTNPLFVALHNRPRGVAVSASGYQPRVFGFESRMILVVPLHGDRRMTQEQNLCVTRTCGLVEGSVQSQALLPRRASIEVQTLDIARPGTILNSQCLELSPRNPQTEERTWASGLVCPRVCTPCIQVVFIYWWGNVWSMASGTPPVTSKEASSLDEYQTSSVSFWQCLAVIFPDPLSTSGFPTQCLNMFKQENTGWHWFSTAL
uniref:Uncharacterized protein n=1 Tax=Timema bartmani TaxID=61472 RepID=A0A7R9F3U6_9NEOP|nr:unnamed protein product [Timema bartmani]